MPALADRAAYMDDVEGNVYAVATDTGEQLWKVRPKKKPSTFFAVTPDAVAYGASGGGVYALDARSGKEMWGFKTDQECSAPVTADGVFYVGCGGDLIAVNASSGEEVWRIKKGKMSLSSPAIDEKGLYFVASDGMVYSFK